jgi:hypothetical protein
MWSARRTARLRRSRGLPTAPVSCNASKASTEPTPVRPPTEAVLAAPLAVFTDGRLKLDEPPVGLARDAPVAPTPPVLETFIRQLQKA